MFPGIMCLNPIGTCSCHMHKPALCYIGRSFECSYLLRHHQTQPCGCLLCMAWFASSKQHPPHLRVQHMCHTVCHHTAMSFFGDLSDTRSIMQVAAQAVLLRQRLTAIFDRMPHDLQQTMLSSPHRAALLQLSGHQSKVSQGQANLILLYALAVCKIMLVDSSPQTLSNTSVYTACVATRGLCG